MLRHKIGTLAGKIWQLMDSKRGDISIKELMGNNEAEIKKNGVVYGSGMACMRK